MSEVRVKGLRELNQFLQQLPVKMERNVLRGALRAGANLVRDQAKETAPRATGKLAEGIKVGTKAKGGRVIANVKLTGPHAFIGPWLEYGVAAHQITAAKGGWLSFGGVFAKSVQHPGIQPRPFMRPALDGQAQAATLAAANYMKQRLQSKHGLDTSDVEIEAQ